MVAHLETDPNHAQLFSYGLFVESCHHISMHPCTLSFEEETYKNVFRNESKPSVSVLEKYTHMTFTEKTANSGASKNMNLKYYISQSKNSSTKNTFTITLIPAECVYAFV